MPYQRAMGAGENQRRRAHEARVLVAEIDREFRLQPEAMQAWLESLRELQLTRKKRRRGKKSPTER